MKIDEMSQQAAVAFVKSVRAEKQPDSGEAHGETSARQQRATDTVDLSSYIPVAAEARQRDGIRANRVEEVKAQLASGNYNVSGRAVAEKMLSKIVLPN